MTLESPPNKCYNTIIKSRKERETALRLLLYTGIAQLVEQQSPKPRAVVSSPSARAKVCNSTSHTTTRQAGDGHTHLTKEHLSFVLPGKGTASDENSSKAVFI